PRTAAPAPPDRRPARTVVVLDRPGQRPALPEPLAEPAAPAPLRRGGRRYSAGPLLRRRDGLLPRLHRLPAPAGHLAGPGGPAPAAPGRGGAAAGGAAAAGRRGPPRRDGREPLGPPAGRRRCPDRPRLLRGTAAPAPGAERGIGAGRDGGAGGVHLAD